MKPTKSTPIHIQNDLFRFKAAIAAMCGVIDSSVQGTVVQTVRVGAMPPEERLKLLTIIKDFRRFDDDNDPYGEHDFGAIELYDTDWFWKIDYFADAELDCGSEDPSDPTKTFRVLTVMHASEY